MLLALDTSTKQAGVALYSDQRGLVAEYNWHSANRHTEELLPAVAQMLAQAGLKPTDLTAIGMALGPGSFTGLRVGLAAAKGLALAHGLPLLGIPTLDAAAYPHQAQPAPVVAVLQAGRGRIYWAPYADGPDGWAAQQAAQLSTLRGAGELRHATDSSSSASYLRPTPRRWRNGRAGHACIFCRLLCACVAPVAWPSWRGSVLSVASATILQRSARSISRGQRAPCGPAEEAAEMPQLVLAPMTPDDLDEIMLLERQCFTDAWTRRMYFNDLTQNELATYLVVRRGDSQPVEDGLARSPVLRVPVSPILAYGGFWLMLDEAHIATVASHPQHRGCGLGEWLMLALLDAAVARGADRSPWRCGRATCRRDGFTRSWGTRWPGYASTITATAKMASS